MADRFVFRLKAKGFNEHEPFDMAVYLQGDGLEIWDTEKKLVVDPKHAEYQRLNFGRLD